MPQKISLGQPAEEGIFKATQLWENIVNHLEGAIKCGRHTLGLRSFNNCFQGSKAVDCLLVYLNATLPKTIKRPQVQILCQKLVLNGVIEDVKDKDKAIFRESRLYKLTKNHIWTSYVEKKKLPRTRSCEEICTEKESVVSVRNDLKGYASDSTVDHPIGQPATMTPKRKKRYAVKERYVIKERDSVYRQRDIKSELCSLRTPTPPTHSGMVRIKSISSIYKNMESTHSSTALYKSKESLYSEEKSRRKLSSSNQRGRTIRRGSVDSGSSRLMPPSSSSRYHTRRQRSRNAEKPSQNPKLLEVNTVMRTRSPVFHDSTTMHHNRRHSLSSASDYAGDADCGNIIPSTPTSTVPSGNKWIVYGFL